LNLAPLRDGGGKSVKIYVGLLLDAAVDGKKTNIVSVTRGVVSPEWNALSHELFHTVVARQGNDGVRFHVRVKVGGIRAAHRARNRI